MLQYRISQPCVVRFCHSAFLNRTAELVRRLPPFVAVLTPFSRVLYRYVDVLELGVHVRYQTLHEWLTPLKYILKFIMTLVFPSTFLSVQDQQACNSAPCSNGGFCINTGNNYRCECTRGYYGRQCEHGMFWLLLLLLFSLCFG